MCFQKPIIINTEKRKCFYDCPKLEENTFCNYERTQIITTVPDGFFINDTVGKTIDKCYDSCKKCINKGDDRNHNCSECLDNYVLLDEMIVQNNCYIKCEFYIFDNILNKYECTQQGFSLIHYSLNKTQSEIFNNLDDLILDKRPNNSYIIKGNDYSIFINPIEREIESSNIIIDFSECLEILKIQYPNYQFRIVKINIDNINTQCLNDHLIYRVYNQFGENIDLSCCENIIFSIRNKITNTSLLVLDLIAYFKNKGVDILNINDDFFQDICYPYSDEKVNSDMTLKDRISDIYQNFSLCDKGCEYNSFDLENLYANCSCKIKPNNNIEINQIQEGNFKTLFLNTFLYSNLGVIKCYKLVFGTKGKLNNIGFWLFCSLLLAHIPLVIIYFINKITPIQNYIENEMNINGYTVKDVQSINGTETKDNKENNIPSINYYNFRKKKKEKNLKLIKKHQIIIFHLKKRSIIRLIFSLINKQKKNYFQIIYLIGKMNYMIMI